MGKKYCSFGLCDMHAIIHCSIFIFFLGGLATLCFYRNNKVPDAANQVNVMFTFTNKSTSATMQPLVDHDHTCDLFSGKWVYDDKSHYPLYREHECPYLEDTFACQTYGRKDSKYQKWRWQPYGCDLPRFDGKEILERLRGKRLLFVGDSLNRNQWNSMICMLYPSISGVKKVVGGDNGLRHSFRATDYNISIDFYWAPMLVESSGDSPTDHHRDDRVVAIKAIEKHARHWVNSDILVFNSYHWWRVSVVKILNNSGSLLDDVNQEYEEVDGRRAYQMALRTWSDWVQVHINASKTKLYFMGATATHSNAKDWGDLKKTNCYGETEPVMDDQFQESRTDANMLGILESSLCKLRERGVNVQTINITQLTQCRKDGHTTIYRKIWRPLSDQQKENPQLASDCSHWCLPGVPDVWNELLLASMFR